MRKLFYPRLAARNIRQNGKFTFPYLLTVAGSAAAFYILCALAGARDLPEMSRYGYLQAFLWIGLVLVGLFSAVFLFYTNSFLMKRRSKELALYNILGMDKRNLSRMLFWETVYTALLGIAGGILMGMLLQKLVTMALFRLAGLDGAFGFYIAWPGIGLTGSVFGVILLLTLVSNLRRIRVQTPVELLHAGAAGEREPRSRWPLAVLGALCLGGGYGIALTTRNALSALALYFVAVFLVVIGTYCLFVAGSITILKLLRRNKKYYYRTAHFIGVSGMIYRMKRNGVGLANICILCTMVLVMVSGTLSLYLGTGDAMDRRYPAAITAEFRYAPGEDGLKKERVMEKLAAAMEAQGLRVTAESDCEYLAFAVGWSGEALTTTPVNSKNNLTGSGMLVALTAQQYSARAGRAVTLGEGEALLCSPYRQIGDTLTLNFDDYQTGENRGSMTFRVAERLDSFPSIGGYDAYMLDLHYLVVADEETLFRLWEGQNTAYGENASNYSWIALLDTDAADQQQIDFVQTLEGVELSPEEVGQWRWYSVYSRAENRQEMLTLNGGFFFLGLFLGLIFIMATVLIMYYKQVSEGYEDRERFQIMQQVGLPRSEIRSSINKQVLLVFFIPLVAAAVHVAFDFRLVVQLLTLFTLKNVQLTLWCTLGTLGLFALIYVLVYRLTARVYYHIVSDTILL